MCADGAFLFQYLDYQPELFCGIEAAPSLKAQAEMQLGILHFGPEKDRPKPDFRVARHTIDLLALLEEKTRGNLTMDEQRLLENSLTELRFRFIQAFESHPAQPAEGQAQG